MPGYEHEAGLRFTETSFVRRRAQLSQMGVTARAMSLDLFRMRSRSTLERHHLLETYCTAARPVLNVVTDIACRKCRYNGAQAHTALRPRRLQCEHLNMFVTLSAWLVRLVRLEKGYTAAISLVEHFSSFVQLS